MSTAGESGLRAPHIPVLDGIRGLAILLVMAGHLWVIPATTSLDRGVGMAVGLGWFGVDLFFVLSGFLITGILLDARSTPNYFRNFYARRILRIFPLYYLVLTVTLVALPRLVSPEQLVHLGRLAGDEAYYWTYLSNFAIADAGQPRHRVLDVTWSLAIEEQFYLIWPLVIAYLLRRHLLILGLVLLALSPITRVALSVWSDYTSFSIYVLTPCRLDGLAAGAIIAVLAREERGLDRFRGVARAIVFLLLPLIVGIPVIEELLTGRSPTGIGFGAVFTTAGYSLLALFFGAVLVLAVTADARSTLSAFFRSRLLIVFGKYSYGLYLVHLPVRTVIRDHLFGPAYREPRFRFPTVLGSEMFGQLAFYVLAASGSLVVAWTIFHLYEAPFLRLKRRFTATSRSGSRDPEA